MTKIVNTFTPGNLDLSNNFPTLCIVGSGLSGLLTAIQIKEENLPIEVVIIDKPQPETNTQLSGMRIRARRAGSRATLPEERSAEITQLLASQNNGFTTPAMKEFGRLLTEELIRWGYQFSSIDPALINEIPEWFGPQWGKFGAGGRGSSILSLLKSLALEKEVKFLTGEVQELQREKETITALKILHGEKSYILRPDVVILANGNAAGRLFLSTNKTIKNSATELLFKAGLPLEGGNLTMWHPFGRCSPDGKPLPGCYETDSLEQTRVFYMDGEEDQETTSLLQEHQAHDHFNEIVKRFLERGGVVQLVDSECRRQFSRVSLHYNHLGARTLDGTQVEETANLAVVGDAGGILHWTNHQPRLPGLALAHCLVSARKACDWVTSKVEGDNWVFLEDRLRLTESEASKQQKINDTPSINLREINTRNTLRLAFSANHKSEQISSWATELTQSGSHDLTPISLALIDSWSLAIEADREMIQEIHPLSRRL